MITTYRYGDPTDDRTLRLGVARQAPRGVRQQDYRRKNYFDLWLRALSPSQMLVRRYRDGNITFREFAIGYRSEMNRPEARQVIALVALISRQQPIGIGCYCEEEARCHRSILKKLVESASEDFSPTLGSERRQNASPVCFANEEHF